MTALRWFFGFYLASLAAYALFVAAIHGAINAVLSLFGGSH